MSERKCGELGFLGAYAEYTSQQESPDIFHLWGAISIIAGALGRKCFVDQGFYKCYPNQYIILVSESARCRKTTAADIAIKLYEKALTREIVTGKITCAMFYKDLDAEFRKSGTSSIFVYSPELGSLLGPDAYLSGLMTAVTDFYGCMESTGNRTKNQGIDVLKKVFVNLLGCTIPSWLAGMPPDMVEGGFSSRVIFVVADSPRPPCPRLVYTPRMAELDEALQADLRTIAEIDGEFKMTPACQRFYESWYVREYAKIDDCDPRLKAYYGRKGDHLIKLSMCLSASRGSSRQISELDMTNALDMLGEVEKSMSSAFVGVAFSSSAKNTERIAKLIERSPGISHADILKRNRLHLSGEELVKVVDTLRESNSVRMDTSTGERRYFPI